MTSARRFVIGVMLAVLLSALFSVEVHAQTRVALLAADSNEAAEDVRVHLTAAGFDVTLIDGTTTTPALADLATYQVVFTWSNAPEAFAYADATALGNVLADFVDSGRGVVHAGSSVSSMAGFGLNGRWSTQSYGAFLPGGFTFANNQLLAPVIANHPILAGLGNVQGGNATVIFQVQPRGCPELVARWQNPMTGVLGRTLVAAGAGPSAGRVVGLNLYPVSADVNPQFWQTDITPLLANAVGYAASAVAHAGGPAVALVAADDAVRVSDVRCKLHNLEMFSQVDAIDAQASTPTLATLLNYDAVLTWTGSSYADAAGMGNVLADYVDANRGIVHSPVSFSIGSQLAGRWISGNYNPLIEMDPASESNLLLFPLVAGHPMLSGVVNVDDGTSSHHATSVLNTVVGETPTVVATWTNGQPMVVFKKKTSGGHIGSLNMFPPSSDALADSWDRNTDGARLMGNMLNFVANHAPTVDAGADLTIEAIAAGVPVTLNATASDVDGDSLTITWSGAGVPTTIGSLVTFTAGPPALSQPSRTYSVTVTVTDGKGGEATDVVNVVVEDTDGPVLLGVPASLTVPATGPGGATLTFGPVTGNDAVDGSVSATCSHSGLFPIGATVVTCSASDSRGNSSSANFTVTVTAGDDGEEDPSTPGKVYGYGYMRNDDLRYEFAFSAIERASGLERGGLVLSVKSGYCGYHRHSHRRNDHFVSKTVESVTFDGHSAVLFTGTGRWNGRDGYRYEVKASDTLVRRRHYDVVRITIKSSTGAIVAEVDGKLGAGNVQFIRMPH